MIGRHSCSVDLRKLFHFLKVYFISYNLLLFWWHGKAEFTTPSFGLVSALYQKRTNIVCISFIFTVDCVFCLVKAFSWRHGNLQIVYSSEIKITTDKKSVWTHSVTFPLQIHCLCNWFIFLVTICVALAGQKDKEKVFKYIFLYRFCLTLSIRFQLLFRSADCIRGIFFQGQHYSHTQLLARGAY